MKSVVMTIVTVVLLACVFYIGYSLKLKHTDCVRESSQLRELIDAQQEALEGAYELIENPNNWNIDKVYEYMQARQRVDSLMNVYR